MGRISGSFWRLERDEGLRRLEGLSAAKTLIFAHLARTLQVSLHRQASALDVHKCERKC